MPSRQINKLVHGEATQDGAGVKLTRVISKPDVKDFDPFLMLDFFDSTNPADYLKGFPMHPHRGIETITYLISGNIEHSDSIGNKGNIYSGGCQWMTAGSGILHQEMPQAHEHMFGVQLWLNLPRREKMTTPTYRDITSDEVPVVEEDGATVRVISGDYNGTNGAIQGGITSINFFDVTLKPNQEWKFESSPANTVFIYILRGSASFYNSEPIPSKTAVLLDFSKNINLTTEEDGARIFYLEGTPLREPIAWGGPIVMSSNAELQHAFDELEQGTFIKHK